MVLRIILHILSNNERLIQRLSESYPVRRTAQLVVLIFYRGKGFIEDASFRKKLTPEQFRSLIDKFSQNLKSGLKQVQEQSKKKN